MRVTTPYYYEACLNHPNRTKVSEGFIIICPEGQYCYSCYKQILEKRKERPSTN